MEYVDFTGLKFNEIPEQDNPAFDDSEPECLMIVDASKIHHCDGVTVLHILPPNNIDRVVKLGHFYEHKNALIFIDAWIKEYQSFLESTDE